ncbi:MAG: hypothetical protein KDJ73_13620 [Notoacmeibacter sp.]|nr:hypothetical protein [Notoacmeibacter sp.]
MQIGRIISTLAHTLSVAAILLTAAAPARAASASEDFWQAVKILQDRGFSKYAILAVLQGKAFDIYGRDENGFPVSVLNDYQARFGVQDASVMVYSEYGPDTGQFILKKSLTEIARTVDQCMAKNRPWRDCTLNYHPVDGCYLTPAQRQECIRVGNMWAKVQTSGEFNIPMADMSVCWNYEKGPGIMLPDQKPAKSQVKLSQAKRVDAIIAASSKQHVKKKVKPEPSGNVLGRPVCESANSVGPVCLFDRC